MAGEGSMGQICRRKCRPSLTRTHLVFVICAVDSDFIDFLDMGPWAFLSYVVFLAQTTRVSPHLPLRFVLHSLTPDQERWRGERKMSHEEFAGELSAEMAV